MASGIKVPGVSISDEGAGRWKLKWREAGPDGKIGRGSPYRAQRFEGSAAEVAALAGRIAAEVKRSGHYRPEVVRASMAGPANLVDGMEAFIAAREAAGKFSAKTASTYRSYKLRVIENLAALFPGQVTLPVTVLSRETFERLMARDRASRASDTMAYAPLRLLLDGWRWMADDPVRWPHTPEPPRSPRDFLPRTPKYTRTVAPSMAHVDACLRHLPERTSINTRMLGIWLKFTGLRADTILSIQREDIDLAEKVLYVAVDKNQYTRTIPLSDALLEEARDWIGLTATGPIFTKRHHSTRRDDTPKKKPSETFKAAWRAATAAGEVPIGVWAPPNRKNTRPEHAIRAAFDAFLIAQGVTEEVVDYLVGRNEDDVRAVHYGGGVLDAARRAVNLVPAIRWSTSDAGGPDES